MTVKMLRACAEVVKDQDEDQVVSVTEIGSEGVIVTLREPDHRWRYFRRYNVARDGTVHEV